MLFSTNVNIEKTNVNFNFYMRKYSNMIWRIRLIPAPNLLFKLFSILDDVVRHALAQIKGTIMQIEKELINDRLYVSKVSLKFCIPAIYNFTVIYPWNLLFSSKVAYFLVVLLSFLFINKNLRLNYLQIRTAWMRKCFCLFSVFLIYGKAIMRFVIT